MAQNALFNFHATFPVDGDDETLDSKYVSMLKELCKNYSIQFERGANTGNYHYQAQFSLKTKSRMKTLASVIRKKFGVSVHLSPTSNEMSDYCQKTETRVRGPWTSEDRPPVWQNPRLANFVIDPWMQSIFDNTEYEHRTIHYVYDPHGNIGKSTCVDLGVQRYGFMEFPPLSSFKESSQMFHSLLKQAGFPTKNIRIMIDIPRNLSQIKLGEFYAGIESVKSGRCLETRYAAGIHYFERPHIWVFSNTLPNPKWLSEDMWKWYIVQDKQLVEKPFDELVDAVFVGDRKRKLGC